MARRTAPSATVATIDLLAQYDLQEEIGVGERARVYRARDRVLDHVVAVKLLHERYGSDASSAARLYHTARAAASLGHPNIVAVYDHGPHDGSAFITMEYVEGANLAEVVRQYGPLPARQALPIVARVLDALSAAHAYGIAHGDLHPRNILVRKGTTDGIVLTDFGMAMAREHAAEPLIESEDTAAPYRAPEQVPGEPASVASDIYAVGVILYELLTGQHPTAGGSRRPASIARLLFVTIQQAIAADPTKRQPSAAALREALTGVGGVALPAVWVAAPEGPLEAAVRVADPAVRRAPRQWRPYRTAAILVAGALTLGGLAGAATLVGLNRTTIDATPTTAVDAPAEPVTEPEDPTPAGAQSVAPTVAPTLPPVTATATLSAPAAALAPAASATPAIGLVQAPTPTFGPRATPTVSTPRVVNSGGAVGVSLENFSPYLLNGAYQPLDVRRKGQAEVALYGLGSGYDTGTLTFEVAALPGGQLTLVLTGLDDERVAHSTIQIVLNGTVVYAGPSTFANLPLISNGGDPAWDQMRLALPKNTLRLGPNTLVIRNTTVGLDLSGPYFLISNVEFAGEEP